MLFYTIMRSELLQIRQTHKNQMHRYVKCNFLGFFFFKRCKVAIRDASRASP